MLKDKFLKGLIFGGVSYEDFLEIRPMIWKRNKRVLNITSIMAIILGGLYFAHSMFAKSGKWVPYLVLFAGSILVFLINLITKNSTRPVQSVFICYSQLILITTYAGILSVQPSNYDHPATSIVAFIALLPLSIDDRVIRMAGFILGQSTIYLIISYYFKSRSAFVLDIMNVVTFSIVGIVLYVVISTRNIREIRNRVKVEKIQKDIITTMATVVEERDENTGGHIQRTEKYVRDLIREMKKDSAYSNLSKDFYNYVILSSPMHDIGKIKIPDAILNKPGKLTDEEYEIMKTHSSLGADIIVSTMQNIEDEDYFSVACNIAKYHHERYDGKGYPEGLSGEDIPIEARIMAFADVYDALVSERVYKKAYPKEVAKKIIEENAGTQFDPKLAELFLKCV